MNRIIEINEESMYAVVEPYVIHAQLQAELMRRGFCCNVNGAGGITSAMPLAAHEGIGHMSGTCSISERNQLALEWVTPEGEIIRTGSLAALGEWFCADGPGPSLRGVVRGNVMPLGGLGVYTKAAVKIYHWAGPPTMEVKGNSPNYVAQNPGNFLLRYLSWPTEEGRARGIQKLGESEIAFGIMGFNPNMVAANVATSNEEELVLAEQYAKEIVGPGFCVVLMGNSPRDFEYKKAVLEQIIKDTGAASLKAVEEGDVHDAFVWRFIRVTASIRETMRGTGVFGGEVFGTDCYRVMSNFIQHSRVDKTGPDRPGPRLPRQYRPVHHVARAGPVRPLGSAAAVDAGARRGGGCHGVRGQVERERGQRSLRPAAPPVQRLPARLLRTAYLQLHVLAAKDQEELRPQRGIRGEQPHNGQGRLTAPLCEPAAPTRSRVRRASSFCGAGRRPRAL